MSDITPEIMTAIKDAATGDKITCASLRKLAEDLDIEYGTAGAAADELKIRVKQCDLGCF